MDPPQSPWNSLEIAKIVASLATPIVVAALGVYIHKLTKRFEHSQWKNQKIVEKRLSIYDDLAPSLNDLLCYFTYIGRWKDLSPPEIIAWKRTIDRNLYLAQPLFSIEFFEACTHFIGLCFSTYKGWGSDAKLRTHFERRKQAHPNWQADWEESFADDPTDAKEIRSAYQRIMRIFTDDIGLNEETRGISAGRVPNNIR